MRCICFFVKGFFVERPLGSCRSALMASRYCSLFIEDLSLAAFSASWTNIFSWYVSKASSV